jgi:HDOD domain-containing protein
MHSAAQPATLDQRSWTGDGLTTLRAADRGSAAVPLLCLPILTRSASLLNLLLQDGTVDLELTSSVVALDPGLAFTTLQLANRERRDEEEAIWQFPLAVVAGGQHRLLQAVNQAPKIESYSSIRTRAELRQLWLRAVVRACLARVLSQQLGGPNPRQAFLAGLLFELPALARLAFPSIPAQDPGLQSASRESLPPEIDAAIAQARRHTGVYAHAEERAQSSLSARLLLAELLLGCTAREPAQGSAKGRDLAASSAWRCWEETSMEQRHALLDRCCALAPWASANAPTMNPWEFTARLERSKGWE